MLCVTQFITFGIIISDCQTKSLVFFSLFSKIINVLKFRMLFVRNQLNYYTKHQIN